MFPPLPPIFPAFEPIYGGGGNRTRETFPPLVVASEGGRWLNHAGLHKDPNTDSRLPDEDGARIPHAPSTVARFGRAWVNHKGVKDALPSKARKTRAEPNPLGGRGRSFFVRHVGVEKGIKHPAPMALAIGEDLVTLAAWPGQTILDPFGGSGTTAVAARKHGRQCVLIEKDEQWARDAGERLAQQTLLDAA